MKMQSVHSNYDKTAPHIMSMEDDLNLAKGFEMVLSEEGYEVSLSGTGQGTLDVFRLKDYDLLLGDLRLPDGSFDSDRCI